MYDNCNWRTRNPDFHLLQILFGYLYNQIFNLGLYMWSLNTVYKHMSADCVPRSPKCAASMWLGCFLRMAVRPRAKESMLAEMALMATWLGPAASWMALWFLSPSDGEWGLAGAAGGGQKTDVRQKKEKRKKGSTMIWKLWAGRVYDISVTSCEKVFLLNVLERAHSLSAEASGRERCLRRQTAQCSTVSCLCFTL